MTTHAEVLLEFTRGLGIETQHVKDRETTERLVLADAVRVGRLKQVTVEGIDALVGTFGSALRLTLGVEGAAPILEIEQGRTVVDVQTALDRIRSLADSMTLHLTLELDKQELTRALAQDLHEYYVLWYLFVDNLTKVLTAPLPTVDTTLFSAVHQATVAVVSDCDVCCLGSMITVIDEQRLASGGFCSAPPGRRLLRRLDAFHSLASERLNWQGFRLQNLTPLHMICDCEEQQRAPVSQILANRALELLVVYTANRSIVDASGTSVVYATPDRSVPLSASRTSVPAAVRTDLARLAVWLQGPGQDDRLSILQNIVARDISGEDPQENYRVFAQRLPRLLRDAQWHHRVFLDGKITEHFEQVESVKGLITHASEEIGQTLDSTTRSFVDALLATLGVVILTLLASLVKGETQGAIFRLGMWGYAVYVLVFQVCYRMRYLLENYRMGVRESEDRLAPFSVVLGNAKVDELTTGLDRRKRHFIKWYSITLGLYLLIVVAIIALGTAYPTVISQVASPSLTPTPAAAG